MPLSHPGSPPVFSLKKSFFQGPLQLSGSGLEGCLVWHVVWMSGDELHPWDACSLWLQLHLGITSLGETWLSRWNLLPVYGKGPGGITKVLPNDNETFVFLYHLWFHFLFIYFFKLFIYLFLAVLDLRWCSSFSLVSTPELRAQAQ